MVEIKKFEKGCWNPDDVKNVKDLTEWCKAQDGVITKGVCIHEGSELTFDDRITIKMPYGNHIPLKDAQGSKGNTKNIDYIGARNVFGVDYDTSKIDYDAITSERMIEAWQNRLDLYISQERSQRDIDRVESMGNIVGIEFDFTPVGVIASLKD